MLRFSQFKRALFGLVGAVLCFGFMIEDADAQLFRRWRSSGNVQSSVGGCPNGVCPTVQPMQAVRSVAVPVVSQAAKPVMQVQAPVITPSVIIREQVVRPAVPARPVSTQSLFGLGDLTTLDDKPRPAAEIPKHVLAQIDEPKDKPMEVADSFRQTLAKAIVQARKSGKINFRDAIKLRVAMRSPAFIQRAQELAVTQVAFSGEESDAVPFDEEGMVQVDGINWEGLAKFLEAFVPLLISLLKAFGL